jgi:phosphoglycolate phosphatase
MHVGLLVTDVDNTLFDWVATWARAFDAMVSVLETDTGRSREYWLRLMRNVHVRRKTIECPAALEDLSAMGGWAPASDRPQILTRAAAAYRRVWDKHLMPYDGVLPTLAQLSTQGWQVVAYSESDASITAARLMRMGFSSVVSRVFGRASSPPALTRQWNLVDIPTRMPIAVDLVPRADLKPNPCGLHDIAVRSGMPLERTVYVGDNLWQDVAMARSLGVQSVWAAYGAKRLPQHTELIESVAHWTPADVASERNTTTATARPDFTVDDPRQLADAVLSATAGVAC